ncbi:hypothetical protein GCM10018954_099910 [Kutzneria kofuensis]
MVSHTDTVAQGVALAVTANGAPSASVAATAATTVARDVIGPPEVLKQNGTELEQLPARTAKQSPVGTVNDKRIRHTTSFVRVTLPE